MTDRPIIFSAPMVRALLDGRKTQTRRVLKPPYGTLEYRPDGTWRPICTKFFPGDRLWVREAWLTSGKNQEGGWELWDYALGAPEAQPDWVRKMPSIHMPRWASRLTLTVTEVRVQRLQEITAEDCTAEGIPWEPDALAPYEWSVSRFADLWNSLHGPDAWAVNPWVCALTFTVQRGNIDRVGAT